MSSTTKVHITKQNISISDIEQGIEIRETDRSSGNAVTYYNKTSRVLKFWDGVEDRRVNSVQLYSSDPSSASINDVWIDETDNKLKYVNTSGSTYEISAGSGGASGGGDDNSLSVQRGEFIAARDTVYLQERRSFVLSDDNKFLDISISGGSDLTVSLSTGNFTFDNSQDYDFIARMTDTALDSAAGGTDTYSSSFNPSTRKWTIASDNSYNFALKFKTGAHGSDSLANSAYLLYGFDSTSDYTGAATYTSASSIEGKLTNKTFAMRTDSDYIDKSKAAFGIDQDGGNKYSTVTITRDSIVESFDSTTYTGDLVTSSGAIEISTSTCYIDWYETVSGSVLSASVAAQNYVWPYDDLITDLNANMLTESQLSSSANAPVYSASYYKDNDTFHIGSTSTFAVLGATGPNDAGGIYSKIKFASADGSAAAVVSGSQLDYKGKLVDPTNGGASSVKFGVQYESGKVYAKRDENKSYIDLVKDGRSFSVTPDEIDIGAEVVIHDMAVSPNGHCAVVLFVTTGTTPIYHWRYKNQRNGAWLTPGGTIAGNVDGTTAISAENFNDGADLQAKAKVACDDDGNVVFFLIRTSSGLAQPWMYYSTDYGATMTAGNSAAALDSEAYSVFPGAIAMRGAKCFMVTASDGNKAIEYFVSTNAGSGFQTVSTAAGSLNYDSDMPIYAFIQYFPGAAAASQYRYIAIGKGNGSLLINASWVDANLSNEGTDTDALGSAVNTFVLCASIDQIGTKNRISIIGRANSDGNDVFQSESNDSSLSFSFDDHSGHDIYAGSDVTSFYNGFTNSSGENLIYNKDSRFVILGSKAYALIGLSSDAILSLFYTKDITSGTWQTPVVVAQESSRAFGSYNLVYVASQNELYAVYQKTTAVANNLTEGQIFYKKIYLGADGTPTVGDETTLDGGEAMASFQGLCQARSYADGVYVGWEHYDGSARDVFWSNKLV